MRSISTESLSSCASHDITSQPSPPCPIPEWPHEDALVSPGLWGDVDPDLDSFNQTPPDPSTGNLRHQSNSPSTVGFSPYDGGIDTTYAQNMASGLYLSPRLNTPLAILKSEQEVAIASSSFVLPLTSPQTDCQPSKCDEGDHGSARSHASQPDENASGQSSKQTSPRDVVTFAPSQRKNKNSTVYHNHNHKTGANLISDSPIQGDEYKKEVKLRNRIASSSHRIKKKKESQTLQTYADTLQLRNRKLNAHATKLREEVQWLKMQLLEHGRCPSPIIQRWILSQACSYVERLPVIDSGDSTSSQPLSTPEHFQGDTE